jgi:putative DNA primase/helicase
MSLDDAMRDACAAVGIKPPRRTAPGRWVPTPVDGKASSNGSGRVLVFDDGRGGVCWNWATGQQQRFAADGTTGASETRATRRDPEAERRAEAERLEVARACERIVRTCKPAPHPYLAAKGFPDEMGLTIDDVRPLLPTAALRDWAERKGLVAGPLLIIPGRIGKQVTTVQFITPDGSKTNILGGAMGGASHRIATGRETWVAEGIATALSVRAALRLLGRPATVLSAFAAQNVARVAQGLAGAIIAADHDRPIPTLGGLGTGEYWARKSGRQWVQPAEMGDWNDVHQRDGLRAVALALREVRPP